MRLDRMSMPPSRYRSPKPTRIEVFGRWYDIIHKSVSMVAIVVGGFWTYDHFIAEEPYNRILNMSLSTSFQSIDSDHVIVTVDVTLKNLGKVRIAAANYVEIDNDKYQSNAEFSLTDQGLKPRSACNGDGVGCTLGVLRYGQGPDFLRNPSLIDWRNGPGDWSSDYMDGFGRHQLLKGYESFSDSERYVIAPGVEYHERAVLILEKGVLYGIQSSFYIGGGGSVSDLTYLRAPKNIPPISQEPDRR